MQVRGRSARIPTAGAGALPSHGRKSSRPNLRDPVRTNCSASKAMSGGVTMKQTYITTSWDDGHQLDLRVAELLTKYRLHGTFYIPKAAENGTRKAAQVRELSRAFEIGAHPLHHVILTRTTDPQPWPGTS